MTEVLSSKPISSGSPHLASEHAQNYSCDKTVVAKNQQDVTSVIPNDVEQYPLKPEPSKADKPNNFNNALSDEEPEDAEIDSHAHASARTTFFPKNAMNYLDKNDETLSNTNANAAIYKEALEESRRRHDRNIKRAQRGVFIANISDDEDSFDSDASLSDSDKSDDSDAEGQNINRIHSSSKMAAEDIMRKNTRENELLGVNSNALITRTSRQASSSRPSTPSSMSRLRTRSRTRSRSRSRHGSAVSIEHPDEEFSRGVSFDTYNNKTATDLSFTLSYKHLDYRAGTLSRTFMCGTDNNKYSDNAATWLFREMVEDGDQIICLRVVEPGMF